MNESERDAEIRLLKQVKTDPDHPYLWLTRDHGFDLVNRLIGEGLIHNSRSGQCRITQTGLSRLGSLQTPVKPISTTPNKAEPTPQTATRGDMLKTRILNALTSGTQTLREIADASDASSVQVKIQLERMLKNYEVVQHSYSSRALPEAHKNTDAPVDIAQLEPDVPAAQPQPDVPAAQPVTNEPPAASMAASAFQEKFGSTPQPVANTGSTPEPLSRRHSGISLRILESLGDGPLTAREITGRIDAEITRVSPSLNWLKGTGQVRSLGAGKNMKWELKKPTATQTEPSQRTRVLDALTLEPEPYTVIAQRCGLQASNVSSVLTRLHDARAVKKHKTPDGLRWSLPGGTNPATRVEPESEPELLEIPEPQYEALNDALNEVPLESGQSWQHKDLIPEPRHAEPLEMPEQQIVQHTEPHETVPEPDLNTPEDAKTQPASSAEIEQIKTQIMRQLENGNSSLEWLQISTQARTENLNRALSELKLERKIITWGVEGTLNVGFSAKHRSSLEPKAAEVPSGNVPNNLKTTAERVIQTVNQTPPEVDPRALEAFNQTPKLQALASIMAAIASLPVSEGMWTLETAWKGMSYPND